jgi:hypothetical protein
VTTGEHHNDRFEERLLGELRRLIVARGPSSSGLQQRRRWTRAWRRRLAVSAAAVAGLAVAIPILLSAGNTPAFAITHGNDGTVTVLINSFQDPTGLEQGLRNAGVPAMVQLLSVGKDCSAPQSWMPVPMSDFPASFNPSTNPQANPPIDGGGVAHAPLTLILRYIPPNATLVIQSIRSAQLRPDNPTNTYMLAISGPGRGMRIFWAQGQVKPCTVVDTSSAK